MSNNKPWTKEEIKILEKNYPKMGTRVQFFLPHRTLSSISHKASRLGIRYLDLLDGKACYLDIECSQLNADFGFMYSWYIKTAGEDEFYYGIITPEEIRNGTLDKRIIKELVDTLVKYKRVYTYYGTAFDLPYARTRALAQGIDFVPYGLIEHRDIYYLVRRILRLHRRRLENVCDLLGITGKTHLDPRVWVMANTGNQEALNYILEHNKYDVIILEKVHKKLQEYEARTRRFI